ncbi:hypothetical protein BABINDRAFT_163974 [Babjeviella inositovora NRRL Y-12698]|uniref:Uncharacterized protein n=1 Tax=Babjeviella inositovora NRRL Y-12698 TaxID=984486 RepID=A0A1E3QGQ3_9ASCO|nr:uncharacterized protein BABINDRAFT_163974 [Babjeviella inositovora NRRL Y-12698]ODQ76893.1 hypothetical protein BABINDRAFT_163974 [Babjeviella inositovora NRRL Y-12698]
MSFRRALAPYIQHPETKIKSDLVFYDDKVTIIRDAFPKSRVHYLILPRDPSITRQSPLTVFDGEKGARLKAHLAPYVTMAKRLVICEMYNSVWGEAIQQTYPPEDDPQCKRYENYGEAFHSLVDEEHLDEYVLAGFHAVPSLENLHIHVLTGDFTSDRLKNRKHYNSFNTPFFINFEDLPFSPARLEAARRNGIDYQNAKAMEQIVKTTDLRCIHCGENFRGHFAQLMPHLRDEYDKRFTDAT